MMRDTLEDRAHELLVAVNVIWGDPRLTIPERQRALFSAIATAIYNACHTEPPKAHDVLAEMDGALTEGDRLEIRYELDDGSDLRVTARFLSHNRFSFGHTGRTTEQALTRVLDHLNHIKEGEGTIVS